MLLKLAEKMIDLCFASLPRKTPSTQHLSDARLVAHRGAHDLRQGIVENTDAAFARALALGCWGIELDVHATADNVLVINHDPTLKRLWGQDVAICDLDFKTLSRLVPQIPRLTEVVANYGKKLHLFIELKAPFDSEKVLQDELQLLEPGRDYHLLSLDETLFASLTGFPLETLLLVPVHNNVEYFCRQTELKKYGGVLGHYLLLTNKKIKKLRLANKIVGVGMVDSVAGLYRELNRGVFWVFSDKVSILTSVRDKNCSRNGVNNYQLGDR